MAEPQALGESVVSPQPQVTLRAPTIAVATGVYVTLIKCKLGGSLLKSFFVTAALVAALTFPAGAQAGGFVGWSLAPTSIDWSAPGRAQAWKYVAAQSGPV